MLQFKIYYVTYSATVFNPPLVPSNLASSVGSWATWGIADATIEDVDLACGGNPTSLPHRLEGQNG
jgi:hypothetical protein